MTTKDFPKLITKFTPPMPPEDGSQKPINGYRLEKELLAASKPPRDVVVRILVNDFIAIPYPIDTAGHVEDFFEDAPLPHKVEIRRFRMPIFTPMHAKVIVIDGKEAYLIGSPLVQEYFDDMKHKIDNPRRGPMGTGNAIKVPIHDMNTRIRGPAVADLDAMFCLHWNAVASDGATALVPVSPPAAEADNVSLQVLRTLKGDNRIVAKPQGEKGILEGYLRAFSNAKRFIYLENQYFTCDDIASALVLALKQTPTLKLIMVLNNRVDIPLYGKYQRKLMQRLIRELPKSERDNRIGFFTVWSHEPAVGDGKSKLMRTYLHTKVGIVDNIWATVGSANLDSVGLTTGDHALLARTVGNIALLGLPALADGLGVKGYNVSEHRSSELNVAIFDDVPGTSNTAVDTLRRMLWAEHFGILDGAGQPNTVAAELADSPSSDWLTIWKNKAATKLAGLRLNPPTVSTIRVLPYPLDSKDAKKEWSVPKVDEPDDYLSALDFSQEEIKRLEIVKQIRSFSFETGNWE